MTAFLMALPDRRLVVFTLALLGLGLVGVYGASSYEATRLGLPGWSIALNHATRVGIGLAACALLSVVPYRTTCRLALLVGVPASLSLMALTVVGGTHVAESAGIGRWLRIFNLSVQPVDLAKLSLVLALPYWMHKHPELRTRMRGGLSRVLLPLGLLLLLLALQPNFGSALALSLLSFCIFYLGGVRLRYLSFFALLGTGGTWLAHAHVGKLQTRVADWIAVLTNGDAGGTMMQSVRALTAIGSGGMFGEGVGRSTMQLRFLPESDTDFVFAILSEEMGFIGAAALVLLFAFWVARATKIALRCRDDLAQLVAFAIAAMIAIYASLNLLMVTAMIPVAGLPLPFVSRGGSALVTNMAACGVLLNIARCACKSPRVADRWGGMPL
ncbi:MAG TPA: FtsW/RodA/SpoVE family cell cycle protein [Candidatus Krumholzibacteria bacterium]